MVQPLVFAYFETFFLNMPGLKNLLKGAYFPSPTGSCIAPTHTTIIYYLTIDIINALNFKMINLKLSELGTSIARNFVLYCCIKEIENF